MEEAGRADHDLLIRIDENVKAIKDRLLECGMTQTAHEERISALEADAGAAAVRQSLWGALAVGLSGAVAAAMKWLK